MNVRLERVRELIRRELATVIERRYSFPNQLITVHDAMPAPDLKSCRIYIGILGGTDRDREATLEKIKAARAAIQRELYKRVKLKNSPQLWFQLDDSAQRGVYTVNLIDNLPPIVQDYGIDESLYNVPNKAMSKKANNKEEEEEEFKDEEAEDFDDEDEDEWDDEDDFEDEDEDDGDDIDEDGDRAYKQE
jgi:ribosome-binding factor A